MTGWYVLAGWIALLALLVLQLGVIRIRFPVSFPGLFSSSRRSGRAEGARGGVGPTADAAHQRAQR